MICDMDHQCKYHKYIHICNIYSRKEPQTIVTANHLRSAQSASKSTPTTLLTDVPAIYPLLIFYQPEAEGALLLPSLSYGIDHDETPHALSSVPIHGEEINQLPRRNIVLSCVGRNLT